MGLSFSDIFDDDIPYEQKPPEMLTPMEEADFPIQAKNLFAGLWEGDLPPKIHLSDLFKTTNHSDVLEILQGLKEAQDLAETDELHFDQDYDYDDRQAFCVFIIYPEFSVWFKRKNGLAEFFSDSPKLKEKLNKFSGFKRSTHHAIRYVLQLISDEPGSESILPKRPYSKDSQMRDTEQGSGRMWGIKGKLYISFWEDRSEIKQVWNKVEKITRAVGHDPKKGLYLFGGTSTEDGINTYEEVTKGLNLTPSDPEAELRRKLHTNPDLKKAILNLPSDRLQAYADRMDIPVVKLKSLGGLDEAQDAIPPQYGTDKHRSISFNDADSIFIIYGGLVTVQQELPDKMVFYSNDSNVEKALNVVNSQKFLPYGEFRDLQLTHTYLSKLVKRAAKRAKFHMVREPDLYGDVAGRVWKFDNTDIAVIGFWQRIEEVRSKWPQVKWALEKLKVDWMKAEYTFTDVIDKKFTYIDVAGIQNNPTFNEKELEIKRKLHVSPELKKAILNLPADRLKAYADRMDIPVVKLKQLAGSGD